MPGSAGGIRAGKAFVELYADKNKLTRGLKAAGTELKQWGAQALSAAKIVGAAGIAAGAAMSVAVKRFADVGSELFDASARTGASVEALSTLGYAAKQSGSDMGELENGMRKAQKTIAGAAGGSKQAAEALSMLGLDAQDLANLAPEEQFRLIARELQAIENPTQKAAAAIGIFGRSGTKLLPMMEGLSELEERARALGLEMSGKDAAAADELGDTWQDLLSVSDMLVVNIGAALAPTFKAVLDTLIDVSAATGKWIKDNRELINSVLTVVTNSDAAWASLKVAWTQGVLTLQEIWFPLAASIQDTLGGAWDAVLDGVLVAIGEMKKAWADFGGWLEETMTTVGSKVEDVHMSLVNRIAAGFFRATGQEALAQEVESEAARAAQEKTDIAGEMRGRVTRNPLFDAIDAETAAARAEIPGLRGDRAAADEATLQASRDAAAKAKEELATTMARIAAERAKGLTPGGAVAQEQIAALATQQKTVSAQGIGFDDIRSAEGFKAVFSALRGGNDPNSETARNTAGILAATNRGNAKLDSINEAVNEDGEDF